MTTKQQQRRWSVNSRLYNPTKKQHPSDIQTWKEKRTNIHNPVLPYSHNSPRSKVRRNGEYFPTITWYVQNPLKWFFQSRRVSRKQPRHDHPQHRKPSEIISPVLLWTRKSINWDPFYLWQEFPFLPSVLGSCHCWIFYLGRPTSPFTSAVSNSGNFKMGKSPPGPGVYTATYSNVCDRL